MRISDWSSDVCSSDLARISDLRRRDLGGGRAVSPARGHGGLALPRYAGWPADAILSRAFAGEGQCGVALGLHHRLSGRDRSEEHTSELQSLMRISYAVFCLKKKNKQWNNSKKPKTYHQLKLSMTTAKQQTQI